ncbi:MAG: hypothetical protein QXX55_02050 [Candidatus Pacearchaeota archaeon]
MEHKSNEKKRLFFIENKKGEEIIYPKLIFIILNLIFISFLIFFVYKSSSGALVYEQAYAKQIALIIDSSKPETNITINFEEALKLAQENGIRKEDIIRKTGNEIIVSFSNKGGYKFRYFTKNKVDFDVEGNNLIIKIKN